MAIEEPENNSSGGPPKWLQTFADLMSLLLTFFILLLSLSTLERKKVTEIASVFKSNLGIMDNKLATKGKVPIKKSTYKETVKNAKNDINTFYKRKVKKSLIELNELMNMTGAKKNNELTLEDSENGFVLKLPSSILFKTGRANLQNEDAVLIIKRIAILIKSMPVNMNMDVSGHTDNVPISNSSFKNLWDLSTARAITIVKELLKSGNNPKRFTASGNAQYRPIATNQTEEGRRKNRRVEIHFYGDNTKLENKGKSILDKAAVAK